MKSDIEPEERKLERLGARKLGKESLLNVFK